MRYKSHLFNFLGDKVYTYHQGLNNIVILKAVTSHDGIGFHNTVLFLNGDQNTVNI